MTTFPDIQRVVTERAVGVKTVVNGIQYGNVAEVGKSDPTAILDAMEAELREKIAACAGEITTARLMPDAQVTGPNLVFKDSSK